MSNDFANYFKCKVAKIYEDLNVEVARTGSVNLDMYSHNVSSVCELSVYDQVSEEDVTSLIQGSATKSCLLDPIPTWLLKEA